MGKVIEELDGLRFFAALWIFTRHFGTSMADSIGWDPFIVLTNRGGAVGLNVFFLLAGFILHTVYVKKDLSRPHERWNFWVARLGRRIGIEKEAEKRKEEGRKERKKKGRNINPINR